MKFVLKLLRAIREKYEAYQLELATRALADRLQSSSSRSQIYIDSGLKLTMTIAILGIDEAEKTLLPQILQSALDSAQGIVDSNYPNHSQKWRQTYLKCLRVEMTDQIKWLFNRCCSTVSEACASSHL